MTAAREPSPSCPAKRRLIAAIPAVLAAVIALAPSAHADGADQYMQWMISHGAKDPLMNGNTLLSQGMQECAALREGKSEGWLIGQLEYQLDRADAEDVVVIAHRYLCPDA